MNFESDWLLSMQMDIGSFTQCTLGLIFRGENNTSNTRFSQMAYMQHLIICEEAPEISGLQKVGQICSQECASAFFGLWGDDVESSSQRGASKGSGLRDAEHRIDDTLIDGSCTDELEADDLSGDMGGDVFGLGLGASVVEPDGMVLEDIGLTLDEGGWSGVWGERIFGEKLKKICS